MNYIPEQIIYVFSEQTLRLDECIFLPLAIESETASDALRRFLEDFPETASHPIFKQWMAIAPFADDDEFPEIEQAIDAIRDHNDTGFLIQVARPVMRYFSGGGQSYSWGNYYTQWIYGADLPEALSRAVEWAKQRDSEDAAEAALQTITQSENSPEDKQNADKY